MENVTKNRSANTSAEQKRLLLDYVKRHPQLLSGKFSNNFTMKDSQKLWAEISNILNSCGGANKDWKSWRKTWHDIRSRTKSKCVQSMAYSKGTGGGPYEARSNEDFYREVLETITNVMVECDTSIKESESIFMFEDKEDAPTHLNEISNDSIPIEENIKQNNGVSLPTAYNSSKAKAPSELIHASEATQDYKESLDKKNKIKEEYYKQKIAILERLTKAKEKSAAAKERIACALEDISKKI